METDNKLIEDGWLVWSKHVLKTIEHHNQCIYDLREENTKLRIEVTKVKLKSGMLGMIAGAIPIITGIGIWMLKKWLG